MCGICGYIASNRIDDSILMRMNDTMLHRGPDDSGVWSVQCSGYAVGLAQRRLSIMDLSELGHQPMISPDGNYIIVFNGEIYNQNDLRNDLEEEGVQFRSTCDTEVLLQGYIAWGDRVLERLNGMFAFAIYDRIENRVLLARDRVGKKPLYYYWNGRDFVFASELKPIMQYPSFPKKIRKEIIARYLCTNYINEPATIFENTYKLEAGGKIVWQNGEIERTKYWNLIGTYQEKSKDLLKDYSEAKAGLKVLLEDAVTRRLIADVPTGAFLSGGIDSTLVTAIASRLTKDRIKTYAIGFEEKEYDEACFAKTIAEYLGTEHTQLYVSETDVARMLERLPFYYDEPFADASQIPTMLVSELARKDITVALTGDGGDELFCGYGMYDTLLQRQKTDALATMIHKGAQLPGIRRWNLLDRLPDNIRGVIDNTNPAYKAQFHLTKLEKKARELLLCESVAVKNDLEKLLPHDNWQITGMLLDMSSYLPNEILTKLDRATMKYSLEGRCPLLDYRVMEYSFRLPHEFKYQDGEKKYILKDLLYDMVPREYLERPKRGFCAPVDKWMREGSLKEKLLDYSSESFLEQQEIFAVDHVQKLISDFMEKKTERYNGMVWAFYVFQEWYNFFGAD